MATVGLENLPGITLPTTNPLPEISTTPPRRFRLPRALTALTVAAAGLFGGVSGAYADSETKLRAGQTVCVDVGHPGEYAIANATIVEPDDAGFATVHKSNVDPTLSSTNNFQKGQTIPNLTLTEIGEDGKLCITPQQPTHALLDLVGFLDKSAVTPIGPNGAERLLDSRNLNGPTHGAKAGAGQTVCVDVGHPGDFAIANATVVGPADAGFATVAKSGANWQLFSTNNYERGQDVPNLTITEIGNDGKLCMTSEKQAHVILDVAAFISKSVMTPAGPFGASREFDSRAKDSVTDASKVAAGQTVCVEIGHPGDFAIANATVVEPDAAGYATVHKSSADPNASSTNNFTARQTIPNATITEIGPDGKLCMTSSVRAHMLIDLVGFLSKDVMTPAGPNGAVRNLDTRQDIPELPAQPGVVLVNSFNNNVLLPGDIRISCEYINNGAAYTQYGAVTAAGFNRDPDNVDNPNEGHTVEMTVSNNAPGNVAKVVDDLINTSADSYQWSWSQSVNSLTTASKFIGRVWVTKYQSDKNYTFGDTIYDVNIDCAAQA